MKKIQCMSVLVIEDNPIITEPLEAIISSKGSEFATTNNGREGLRLIKEQKWDSILLDLAMPEFSGYDVIDALEQDGKLKDNKIIVFTAASITDDQKTDLVDRGVHSVLRKPCSVEQILKSLDIE